MSDDLKSCIPIHGLSVESKWKKWCKMNCGIPPQLHPACIGNGPHVKCKCSQTSSGRKNGSKNLNHVVQS